MDKHSLLQYWAGDLIRVKAELRQIGWLLQQGVPLNRAQQRQLDKLLDRKLALERLIEELRNQK